MVFSCVRNRTSHQRINQAKNHINPRNRSATMNHSTYSIPCLISASSLSIVGGGLGSSAIGRVAPHFPHKLASSGLSVPQFLHFVILASGFESPHSPMVFSELADTSDGCERPCLVISPKLLVEAVLAIESHWFFREKQGPCPYRCASFLPTLVAFHELSTSVRASSFLPYGLFRESGLGRLGPPGAMMDHKVG
jgi:hypothetical protein